MSGDLTRALELAYRHLGRRDRTVAEVRAHLAGKDCDEDAIDAAVAELSESGYLDDARYAVRFAEDLSFRSCGATCRSIPSARISPRPGFIRLVDDARRRLEAVSIV